MPLDMPEQAAACRRWRRARSASGAACGACACWRACRRSRPTARRGAGHQIRAAQRLRATPKPRPMKHWRCWTIRDFAAAFAPGSQRRSRPSWRTLPEFGDRRAVNGRIDRLAVTDDEVLILDFKTNRPPPAARGRCRPGLSGPDGALPRRARRGFSRTANRLRPGLDRRARA